MATTNLVDLVTNVLAMIVGFPIQEMEAVKLSRNKNLLHQYRMSAVPAAAAPPLLAPPRKAQNLLMIRIETDAH